VNSPRVSWELGVTLLDRMPTSTMRGWIPHKRHRKVREALYQRIRGPALSGWKQFTCAKFSSTFFYVSVKEFHIYFQTMDGLQGRAACLRIASVWLPSPTRACPVRDYLSAPTVWICDLDAFIRFEPPTMAHLRCEWPRPH